MIDNIPHCCATTDGRIGIFLGRAYRFMTLEAASSFIEELRKLVLGPVEYAVSDTLYIAKLERALQRIAAYEGAARNVPLHEYMAAIASKALERRS